MLELREAVSKPMWRLRTELRSSKEQQVLSQFLLPQNYFKEKIKDKANWMGYTPISQQ